MENYVALAHYVDCVMVHTLRGGPFPSSSAVQTGKGDKFMHNIWTTCWAQNLGFPAVSSGTSQELDTAGQEICISLT